LFAKRGQIIGVALTSSLNANDNIALLIIAAGAVAAAIYYGDTARDVVCIDADPWRPIVASALAAVIVGCLIVNPLHALLERRMDPRGSPGKKGVQPWLMGLIERLVFAPAFLLSPDRAATGAFAWLALKLAANWQHQPAADETGEQRRDHRRRAVRALLLGLLSLAIAAAVVCIFGIYAVMRRLRAASQSNKFPDGIY
jgi:hypothetical protein